MDQRANTASICFAALARIHEMPIDETLLSETLPDSGEPNGETLGECVASFGYQTQTRTLEWDELAAPTTPYPFLARLDNGNWVLVEGFHRGENSGEAPDALRIFDPQASQNEPFDVDRALMEAKWSGESLAMKPTTKHSLVRSFSLIARHEGQEIAPENLIHQYNLDQNPPWHRFARMTQDLRFKSRQKQGCDWQMLTELGEVYPVIARLDEDRYVVLVGAGNVEGEDVVDIIDPSAPPLTNTLLPREEFEQRWDNTLILLKRTYDLSDESQPFGLRWFIPEIIRQKQTFSEVALAAIMINLIALATPLFFQIVIDKVLTHNSVTTLQVLGVGILLAIGFDSAFNYLRGYIILHGTSKIDIRVATRTFGKLASLRIDHFERSSVGVLVKHMQQADTVREFLTGQLFFTFLDSLALFLFIPVLFFYSPFLAAIVLLFSVLIAAVMFYLLPRFKKRLEDLYEAQGKREAFLVESITGIQTIKSLALEPKQKQEWDTTAAAAVKQHVAVGKISVSAQSITGFMEKVMVVAIIWLGVNQVFSGAMTVGALIAFQMLSSRVSSPLVQIVSLIHHYQEAALSVRMLGTIMNAKSERGLDHAGLRPDLAGDIVFDHVHFRYTPDSPPALNDISLTIPGGTIIGIVGKSGSGKSTLARLIQGLYPIQEGIITINGMDLRDADLVHLRRNTGIVLQESFLFRGTVKENLSKARPDATFEEIYHAAHLAGADEFIQKLPQGYDTLLEEGAVNLSGGQKQRLAIARALLGHPPILILDEATSALDAESEEIVQNGLEQISAGRTLIIISHRLSMLSKADKIVVMGQGRIVDTGTEDELLSRCDTYRNLWESQNQHILSRRSKHD